MSNIMNSSGLTTNKLAVGEGGGTINGNYIRVISPKFKGPCTVTIKTPMSRASGSLVASDNIIFNGYDLAHAAGSIYNKALYTSISDAILIQNVLNGTMATILDGTSKAVLSSDGHCTYTLVVKEKNVCFFEYTYGITIITVS